MIYANDERSYGSVYTTDVKKILIELISNFNYDLGTFRGPITMKRDYRRDYEIENDWNYAYTHDQSCIDVNLCMRDCSIKFISRLIKDENYNYTNRAKSPPKTYHMFRKELCSKECRCTVVHTPFYIKKLRVKLGLVRY